MNFPHSQCFLFFYCVLSCFVLRVIYCPLNNDFSFANELKRYTMRMELYGGLNCPIVVSGTKCGITWYGAVKSRSLKDLWL